MTVLYPAELLDAIYRIYARMLITAKQPTVKSKEAYSLEEIESLPADWNGFWLKAAENCDLIFDRSASLQNWLYFNNPEKYSFITVRNQDKLIEYCVYRNIIADYLFLSGHEPAFNFCLDQIFDKFFRASVRSLSVWCDANSPYYTIFKSRGFRDQNRIPVILHCENFYEEIEAVNSQHFTIGDSDNV